MLRTSSAAGRTEFGDIVGAAPGRQIATEGARGLGFFLATIDEGIAARDLQEILDSRIILVVPTRVKQSRADYASAMNVITFEFFFEHHLDPAMAMRRRLASGVIH